ncbi:hypothetical protein E8K88_14415 [Lampropedia aestuarii]|uniref:Type I restriction modification DNA specificity domain-containing protein n=1 Tax=Lampropedia aestuarii TaxID=2562762 RepID=A0A4S5BHB9_9BURK|nr:restriction endonuclease subunit S [Lampropedia aestuarii]THJ31670.1 hypothetical protein E8K88_14415 [Lampropedia aestuarii]
MKPYVSYKPSGVPWLGEVPAHWQVEKVKFQARLRGEKAVGTNGARYVGMEHVLPKVGKFNPVVDGTQEEAESTVNVFSKGDVLFGKLRPYLAKCVVADTDGVCSSEFLVLAPSDEVVPAYLNATMLMQEFIDAVDASTYGAKMPRADWGFIGQQRLPLPPPDEQQAIADYLDAETARIDTLIYEKDELIGLLREWRQSVIAEAVTKGLDKSVATKPSGVPWLGDVPKHWVGKRLRDCVEGCSNGVWGDEPDGGDDDIPVIRVADFDRNRRQVVDYETLRKVDSSQRGSRGLRPGDMLMEKSGGGEQQPVGMVVSYFGPEGAVCSNFVARMRSREGVVPRFMVYLHAYLYASRVSNISVKQTTGIQNLDSTAYLSEACFVPPHDEQQAIADYLDAEAVKIDDLIDHTHDEITLLKELRAATIADAVLGRVDVRAKT